MAPSRLAVAIVLAMAASARAGTRVHSYAYVTGLTTDYETAADEGVRENRCEVTARLPRAILKEKPTGDDQALLAGATLVGERVSDPEKHCEDYLHTWQRVDFDPAHRADVHFAWPRGDIDTGHLLIGVIMLGVIGYAIVDRLRYRWRTRRHRHRRDED